MAGITCDAALADLLRDRRRVILDFIPGRGRHVWYPPEKGEPAPGTPCECGRERWSGAAAAPKPPLGHP